MIISNPDQIQFAQICASMSEIKLEIIERKPYREYGFDSEEEQTQAAIRAYKGIKSSAQTQHDVWTAKEAWACGVHFKHPPSVGLCNEDDSFYTQYFNSRQEIEAFIDELKKAADEAWGTNGNT